MKKKQEQQEVKDYGSIGIFFTIEELIAALIEGSVYEREQTLSDESIKLHLAFDIISKDDNGKPHAGIKTKTGSLQEFLANNTCLARRIAISAEDLIKKKESEKKSQN